jgi:hypothetical protein
LTILYCSTDCLCRCGAAVKNLSHCEWRVHSPQKWRLKIPQFL